MPMVSKRPTIIGLPASLLPPAMKNMAARPIWTTQRAIVSALPAGASFRATGGVATVVMYQSMTGACGRSRSEPGTLRCALATTGSGRRRTPQTSENRLPTRVNASTARSTISGVCAAESCTRMRDCPVGTTGNEKPMT